MFRKKFRAQLMEYGATALTIVFRKEYQKHSVVSGSNVSDTNVFLFDYVLTPAGALPTEWSFMRNHSRRGNRKPCVCVCVCARVSIVLFSAP
jgi:hypothetical protein